MNGCWLAEILLHVLHTAVFKDRHTAKAIKNTLNQCKSKKGITFLNSSQWYSGIKIVVVHHFFGVAILF
jgi:hypothetical protein